VREVYQADSARYDWERGTIYLRRWRVYEFTYVIENKNEGDIDHFYLEVYHPPTTPKKSPPRMFSFLYTISRGTCV
jgi:hypothetical protein